MLHTTFESFKNESSQETHCVIDVKNNKIVAHGSESTALRIAGENEYYEVHTVDSAKMMYPDLFKDSNESFLEDQYLDEFDLETAYNHAPQAVKDVLDRLPEEPEYTDLQQAADALEFIGWHMDYGLDAGITDLRPIEKRPSTKNKY